MTSLRLIVREYHVCDGVSLPRRKTWDNPNPTDTPCTHRSKYHASFNGRTFYFCGVHGPVWDRATDAGKAALERSGWGA